MHIRTPLDLGLVVRERRRALGLDQARLAELVGVSRQWIVEMEHGKRRAELALALRTLNVLGIRLWADSDAPANPEDATQMTSVDIGALVDSLRETPAAGIGTSEGSAGPDRA